MAGYNRISPNPFVDGAIIEAADFDTEFGALDTAFGTSGHTHDGTDGNGPKIDTAGLALNAVDSTILDETDSSYVVAGMTINSLTVTSGTAVTSIDTDLTSVSATDNTLASAKAIKTYVDAQVDTADQLTELTDVTITSVADNEVLAYDNTSSKWINQTAVEAGLQPNDAGLTSIAGLTTSANQMIYTTGSDTYATTSLTAAGRAILDDASASAQRTTLGLAIGTNVQAYDAGLNSIAGLTTAANKMIYTTGSDTYSTTDLSSFGRSLIDDADASAARTTLGLGTAATTASTAYATSAQGALADSAVQPSDNISTLTNNSGYITGYTVTESDVTTHQAALSITESQISDLGSYLTGNQTITLSGDATGSGTTAITVALASNTVGVDELNLTDGSAGQFLKTDGAGTISFADAPTQQTSFTVLDVDNLNLDGNTISATNTNGGINLTADGNGEFTITSGVNLWPRINIVNPDTQGSAGIAYTIHETKITSNDVNSSATDFVVLTAKGDPASSSEGSYNIEVARNGFQGGLATGLLVDGVNEQIRLQYADLKIANNKGIDFSNDANASGMSSELLDDYEEGTFDPYFAGNTDYNTASYYSVQDGTYTKVGRVVHFDIRLVTASSFPNASSDTGLLEIKGLPFTASKHAAVAISGENHPTANTPQAGEVRSSTTQIRLFQSSGDNAFTFVGASSLGDPGSTGQIYVVSGSYIV